jgi:hypothetical protein
MAGSGSFRSDGTTSVARFAGGVHDPAPPIDVFMQTIAMRQNFARLVDAGAGHHDRQLLYQSERMTETAI